MPDNLAQISAAQVYALSAHVEISPQRQARLARNVGC